MFGMRFRRPPTPRFQFTISGLLVATLFVAVLCALVGAAGALLIVGGIVALYLLWHLERRTGPTVAVAAFFFLVTVAIVLTDAIHVCMLSG